MTILKRLKIPLYYLKKRHNKYIFKEIDQSIFIKKDDFEFIDIDTDKLKIKNKNKKNKNKKKSSDPKIIKSKEPGEWSLRINHKSKLNSKEKTQIKSLLTQTLQSQEAHEYFGQLIKSAMESNDDENSNIFREIEKLITLKKVFRFHLRNSGTYHFLYSIIPNNKLPKTYINKEIIESFILNIIKFELNNLIEINDVQASLR